MNRNWLTGVVIGGLALIVLPLVVLALRPAPVETPPVAPFQIGTIEASGDSMWRWVGPRECNVDADVVQLERRTGDGGWLTNAIPLANVYGISFADDERGIAVGTTKRCARGVAITTNGGRNWRMNKDNPVLLDARYVGSVVWGVERVIGAPQLAAFRVTKRLKLVPMQSIEPVRPCAASDGVPSKVAFWTQSTGLLLCQNTVIDVRLLARTTNSATNFEALNDDRPAGGLDGVDEVVGLDVTADDSVWAQFGPGSDCPEGQLRYSKSQGAVFDRLPCPSNSVPIDEVLDVVFTSAQDGVMLALRDRAPVMLTTIDGGATWATSS